MMNNPILEELRKTREQLLFESGGSLDDLVDRLRKEQAQSGRPIYAPQKNQQGKISPITDNTIADGESAARTG